MVSICMQPRTIRLMLRTLNIGQIDWKSEFQYEMSCQTFEARRSEAKTTGRHERACSNTPSERASSRSM